MFGSIGMQELIIIFVIALIIFGPRRLPDLGKSLGKSIAEFKRASNELRNTLEDEIRVEEQKLAKPAAAPETASPETASPETAPPETAAPETAPAPEPTTEPAANTTAPASEPGDSPTQQG